MKSYVLTTKDSNRLQDGKIIAYPSVLPEPTPFYGFDSSSGVEIPNFSVSNNTPGTWLCNLSKITLFEQHLQNCPNEDLLLLEDDVQFSPLFNDMYQKFMDSVPEDWSFIFLGGHHYEYPKEVKQGVLRAFGVWGNECVIFRSTVLPKVIEALKNIPWQQSSGDRVISTLFNDYAAYSPVGMFACQRNGYSYSYQRDAFRGGIHNFFYYIDTTGELKRSTELDYLQYLNKPLSDYKIDIVLSNELGNALYSLAYGRYLRSLGISVSFVVSSSGAAAVKEFIEKECNEPVGYREIKIPTYCRDKASLLFQGLGEGYINQSTVYPEYSDLVSFKPIDTQDIIGVNFSRKYCTPPFVYSLDLCRTDYYEQVSSKCKELGLPVRIITDMWDTAVPENIKALFPNAEVVVGDAASTFYPFAECRYKFLTPFMMPVWAAYANPESIVFYPLNTTKGVMLPKWTGLSIMGKVGYEDMTNSWIKRNTND